MRKSKLLVGGNWIAVALVGTWLGCSRQPAPPACDPIENSRPVVAADEPASRVVVLFVAGMEKSRDGAT